MTSAFAPKQYSLLPALEGISLSSAKSEVRYKNRLDTLHVQIEAEEALIAGVFTQNLFPGEPVKWCRKIFPNTPKALLVCAGNANVCTGNDGWQALEAVANTLQQHYGNNPDQCYIAMTGVIGEALNPTPIIQAIENNPPKASSSETWHQAAQAIMTTDTFPKLALVTAKIDNKPIVLSGIAKGSGMIAPNMATMLVFLFTDVRIAQPLLQKALKEVCEDTFNAISVDSDTSTSDTLLLISTQNAKNTTITQENSLDFAHFKNALHKLCHDLALQVIGDGEGITKRIDLHIVGAKTETEAKTAGLSVINSPLVKTAISGEDANWGRIVMALGKADISLNADKLSIELCKHRICDNGQAVSYDVSAMDEALKSSIIPITVDLGVGTAEKKLWGNDLSYDYIRINADYRS